MNANHAKRLKIKFNILFAKRLSIAESPLVNNTDKAVKTIRKYYNRLDQAERYQNWLYGRHDSVKLIESPRFSEGGFYAWKVS